MEHVHESPLVMIVPLVVLAIGAVVAGFAASTTLFIGEDWQHFWRGSIFNRARTTTCLRRDGRHRRLGRRWRRP